MKDSSSLAAGTESLLANRTNEERKRDAVKRKVRFLAAFSEWGSIRKACELVNIQRPTYKTWLSLDYVFANDMAEARRIFAEELEELAYERVRNPDKNRGSDLLLIGLLNAHMPDRYRPAAAMNDESAREVISELRKLSRNQKVESPAEHTDDNSLPAPVEQTLAEILARRIKDPEKREESL